MDTTNQRWMQLSFFAAAALLIVAVAAVTLTAGPTQAQGVIVEPFSRPDNNEEGYKALRCHPLLRGITTGREYGERHPRLDG